jgi:predicted ArsR family transcriptional regulator
MSSARRTDPQTSHDAAASIEPAKQKHYTIILECMKQLGAMTADEIATHSTLQTQQVNKRLPELLAAKSVKLTGQNRPSLSGRPARVWALA